jgi:hypothetical protein
MNDLSNVIKAAGLHKTSDDASFQEALQNYYSKGLRSAALQRALGIGATGLGVGLGVRGLLGLLNLGKGNISPEDIHQSSIIELEGEEDKEAKDAGVPDWYGSETSQYLGYGDRSEDEEPFSGVYHGIQIGEEDSIPSGPLSKLFPKKRKVGKARVPDIIAALKEIKGVDVKDEASDDLVEFGWGVNDEVPHEGTPEMREAIEKALFPEKQANFLDFMKGRYAETVGGVPWAIPAAVGAGAGGLYGGWRLMDYLLDRRRKANLDDELETAKLEYEAALARSSDDKEASDDSLGDDLDTLFNNIDEYGEKAAASWPEIGGQAMGMYGTAAGVAALLAAILGHKYGKKRQRKKVLESAQARKRREEYKRRPDPLYVRQHRSLEMNPTVADASSDAAPSLDEIEDLLS